MNIPHSFNVLLEVTRAQQELRFLQKLRYLQIFAVLVNFGKESVNPGHISLADRAAQCALSWAKAEDVLIIYGSILICTESNFTNSFTGFYYYRCDNEVHIYLFSRHFPRPNWGLYLASISNLRFANFHLDTCESAIA